MALPLPSLHISPRPKRTLLLSHTLTADLRINGPRAPKRVRAIEGAANLSSPTPDVSWQIVVGALAGVMPFVVAGIEFGKRIEYGYRRKNLQSLHILQAIGGRYYYEGPSTKVSCLFMQQVGHDRYLCSNLSAAQKRCEVCRGSGLVLMEDEQYVRCPGCGGFLPWQSWKRFFTG